MRSLYLSLIFFAHLTLLNGQISERNNIVIDSLEIQTKKTNSFTSIFYGQPGKAALYSLVLPGAGQVYNKRIWKVPLVYAVEGFAAYNLITKIKTFQDRDQCWRSFVLDATNPNPICTISNSDSITTLTDAFNRRQSTRSQKDLAWVFMGVAHLLNVVEAFVDRHLINFDTSEDLSFGLLNHPSNFSTMEYNTINFFTINIPIKSK